MFPPAPHQPLASPASSSWRDTFRHALDLTVAFTTLESYSVEDVWPPRRSTAPAAPDLTPPHPAPVSGSDAPRRRRAVASALDPKQQRRPGATRGPAQPCTTPLPAPKQRAGGPQAPGATARNAPPATAAARASLAARSSAARSSAARSSAARSSAAGMPARDGTPTS